MKRRSFPKKKSE